MPSKRRKTGLIRLWLWSAAFLCFAASFTGVGCAGVNMAYQQRLALSERENEIWTQGIRRDVAMVVQALDWQIWLSKRFIEGRQRSLEERRQRRGFREQ